MGRVYAVTFAASAQAGAVDWFELITGAAGKIAIVGWDIGQTTELSDAAEEQIDFYVKRGTSTYTSGSGGNTGVARTPVDPGDSAATFTAESLNTTRIAVGTGSLLTLYNSTFNVRAGSQVWFPENAYLWAGASSALAIGMTGAPTDSITWVGTVWVLEAAP